jgi:hypothetical protein
MQALQSYTPEYKKELLSRAERTWRPGEQEMGDTEENDVSAGEEEVVSSPEAG